MMNGHIHTLVFQMQGDFFRYCFVMRRCKQAAYISLLVFQLVASCNQQAIQTIICFTQRAVTLAANHQLNAASTQHYRHTPSNK